MTILEKKNVFFMINGSKYIIYVKIARGDRIPLRQFDFTLQFKISYNTYIHFRIQVQTVIPTLESDND